MPMIGLLACAPPQQSAERVPETVPAASDSHPGTRPARAYDGPPHRVIDGFAVVAPQPGPERFVYGAETLLVAEPGELISAVETGEGVLIADGSGTWRLATLEGGRPALTEPFALRMAPRQDPLDRGLLFFRSVERPAWFRRDGAQMREVPLPGLPGGPPPGLDLATPVEGPDEAMTSPCTLAVGNVAIAKLDAGTAGWLRVPDADVALVALSELEYRGLDLHVRVRPDEGSHLWDRRAATLEVDRGGEATRQRVEVTCPQD